jgi:hypothetical protein
VMLPPLVFPAFTFERSSVEWRRNTQHNDTNHNDTQHINKKCSLNVSTVSFMILIAERFLLSISIYIVVLSVVLLSVIMLIVLAPGLTSTAKKNI